MTLTDTQIAMKSQARRRVNWPMALGVYPAVSLAQARKLKYNWRIKNVMT